MLNSISINFEKYVPSEKKSNFIPSPNSARGEQLAALMSLMKEDTTNRRRWARWAGKTKHLMLAELYQMLQRARYGDNPQALFNYLLAESKKPYDQRNK